MRRYLCVALALALAAVPAAAQDKDWGTLKGQVIFDNNLPIPAPKQLKVDKDQQACLARGPIFSEEWVVNKENRGVQWTYVWLAPEQGAPPLNIHPALQAIKDKEVMMDQPCCKFEPHALALREGQDLVVNNSAAIAHNVHLTALKNASSNVIVPPKGQHVVKSLKAERLPITVSCDIHGWMKAYVRVFDHPYFAVTDKDGKWEIKDAPAGNYRLIVWHEGAGWGPGGKNGIPVTVKAGETTGVEPAAIKPAQ